MINLKIHEEKDSIKFRSLIAFMHNEKIVFELQPNNGKPIVSGNEVAVCPRCSAEHSETDCHGYCTAACMQEDEGQTDR